VSIYAYFVFGVFKRVELCCQGMTVEEEFEKAKKETEEESASEEDDEEEEDEEEDERPVKRARVIKRRPVFSDKLPAIPVAAFKRLVREVTDDQKLRKNSNILWEGKAFEALQVGAEAFLVDKFYESYKRSLMCKKKTVGSVHFAVQ
jgi:histone H3/H4